MQSVNAITQGHSLLPVPLFDIIIFHGREASVASIVFLDSDDELNSALRLYPAASRCPGC